jgi:hypothetical protein
MLKFRGEVSAIRPLIDLAFHHTVDIIEGLAIVDCLVKIGGNDARIALQHLADHIQRTSSQKPLIMPYSKQPHLTLPKPGCPFLTLN